MSRFATIVADMESGVVRSAKASRAAKHPAQDATPPSASRKPRSIALKHLLKQLERPKSAPRPAAHGSLLHSRVGRTLGQPSLLGDKEAYDALPALMRLDAMAHEALNNAKSEL